MVNRQMLEWKDRVNQINFMQKRTYKRVLRLEDEMFESEESDDSERNQNLREVRDEPPLIKKRKTGRN